MHHVVHIHVRFVFNMAEEGCVSVVNKRKERLKGFKMHETLVNGLVHEQDERLTKMLAGNGKNMNNGHDKIPKKLNGVYNFKPSSGVGEAIKSTSLRSSPVRNNVMVGNSSDSSKVVGKDEVRLKEGKKDGSLPCKWMDCNFVAADIVALASHAKEQHIDTMKCCDVFVCLWQGCKVFNRPSCSMTWLTKHLESHIGVKPFKCVFDSCPMSFSSHTGLARHVPCHFEDSVRPAKRTAGSVKEESPIKKHLKRRHLKYIRYKKANTHGKTEDFVDQHATESIKTRLSDMIVSDTDHVGIDGPRLNFKSQAWGRRVDEKGITEILLHWTPEAILPDEWVPSTDVKQHLRRSIPIHQLPNHIQADLHPSFYRRLSHRRERRK